MQNFCNSCACSPPKSSGRFTCLKGHDFVYVGNRDPETKEFKSLMIRSDLKECPDFVDTVNRPTRLERVLGDDIL
jgi:hypothetical protein